MPSADESTDHFWQAFRLRVSPNRSHTPRFEATGQSPPPPKHIPRRPKRMGFLPPGNESGLSTVLDLDF